MMNSQSIVQRNNHSYRAPIHSNVLENIRHFDLFRHPFRFQLPNGFSSVSSIPGICATYFLIILTIAYGTINIIELNDYGKTTMRLDVIDYYYEDTDIFEHDKSPGLNIAFGITHYDNNTEPYDLDYG